MRRGSKIRSRLPVLLPVVDHLPPAAFRLPPIVQLDDLGKAPDRLNVRGRRGQTGAHRVQPEVADAEGAEGGDLGGATPLPALR